MGRYLEIRAKAQAQLDEMVGEDRLPRYSQVRPKLINVRDGFASHCDINVQVNINVPLMSR